MDEGTRSKKSVILGMPQGIPSYYLKEKQATKLGDARVASPLSSNDHRVFYLELYFYSSHIMSFAWSILYYMSLCFFCFLACVVYPCWTHLFERAKIMLRFVRIALCASLKKIGLWNCSSASLISFWAWCALIFLKKCYHASLRFFWRNSLMLHLYYFDRQKIKCSCSWLRFVWAYQKQLQYIKLAPKW